MSVLGDVRCEGFHSAPTREWYAGEASEVKDLAPMLHEDVRDITFFMIDFVGTNTLCIECIITVEPVRLECFAYACKSFGGTDSSFKVFGGHRRRVDVSARLESILS